MEVGGACRRTGRRSVHSTWQIGGGACRISVDVAKVSLQHIA